MINTNNDKIIRLRLFNEDDLDDVVKVNRECLPENYAPYFFMEIYYKYPKGFWVAVNVSINSIIGYCMWRTEKSFSYFKKSLRRIKVAHLISIAVLKDQRRKKIGQKLLNHGIESMKNEYEVKECYLEVR
ncbi:MAG: GNAT family N-acetyltransferase, partial [Candidatus Lokiarchaeota archaeon]|nr:GNAT family N-acetyltransferase [Candidatus Lokiarchaeota archaeon]